MARVFQSAKGLDLSVGGVSFPAGVSVNVSDMFAERNARFRALVDAGEIAEVGEDAPVETQEPTERQAVIAGIIRGFPVDDDHYTKGGKPEVDAINGALPEAMDRVTAAERDAVWMAMQDG